MLVKSWMEVSPAILGIDWSRYIFLLAGLGAASAGLGNLVREWLEEHGIYLHAHHPKLTWFALAAAGVAVLFFSDKLSYMGHLALNLLRGRPWAPDRHKAWVSLGANLLVWGFVVLVLTFPTFHIPLPSRPSIVDLLAPRPPIPILFIAC